MAISSVAAAPPYIPQITASAAGGRDVDGDTDHSKAGEVENAAPTAPSNSLSMVGSRINITA